MFLWFILTILFTVIGCIVAKNNDKDPVLWGIICFFTGFIGLIILLIVVAAGGNTSNTKEVHHYHHNKDNKKK